jgi:large subunit ribosomal protein L25
MARTADLKASARERVGKGAARELRREGLIPAVIYGDKQPPLPISISYKEAMLSIHAGGFLSRIINVEVDGEKHKVIPRDYQLDPVRDFAMHVDFLRIGKNTRLTIEVPVHFLNEEECPGLKRGGVLNIVRHTVEVTCPASAIPESFDVDMTGLEVGDSIHISAVELPEGVNPTITDRDFTIATLAAPSALRSEEGTSEDEEEASEEETEEATEE